MPPIAPRLAVTAAWPWWNTMRYIVISPSVIVPRTAAIATQAYAPYNAAMLTRPARIPSTRAGP